MNTWNSFLMSFLMLIIDLICFVFKTNAILQVVFHA